MGHSCAVDTSLCICVSVCIFSATLTPRSPARREPHAQTLAAAQSFLRMLHSRHKPRGAALDPSERAAEQRLERTAVWFLGENANFATGEFAWADVRDAQKFARFSEFRRRVASARGAGWDDEMEAAAREEAAGRPLLGSVIRDLQT